MTFVSLVWVLVVIAVASAIWYAQRDWEQKHPGKRGVFFADADEWDWDCDCNWHRKFK